MTTAEVLMDKVLVGVDVGSTAVRVGYFSTDCKLLASMTRPISHTISTHDHRFVTQSSTEIWGALQQCLDDLKYQMGSPDILAIGVAATCSVVVMERSEDGHLTPYPADYGFDNNDQNVIFWMDTRAEKETEEMNQILEGADVLGYMGGSFLEEMGLPKVKYILDNAPKTDNLVFFDLHDYLSSKLGETPNHHIRPSNEINTVAIDGEVKGWSADILNKLGMAHLVKDNFRAIGSLEQHNFSHISPVPSAGSPIGNKYNCVIAQGLIDSYGGWLGSCGKSVEGTLTMVAGTSTCFIFAHKTVTPVKSIWGPFKGLFDGILVSEAGQATTGKLIEHLFETHPAYQQLSDMGPDGFATIESLIEELEVKHSSSIHYLTKHMFLFGELSGNRTPYADASLRAAFFGESTDITVKDLVLKYVCIIECLAFQAKQVLSLLPEYGISKVNICGSQAKNKRLVKLLARITGLPVEVSITNPEFSGIYGASYLAYTAYKHTEGVKLLDVVQQFNNQGTVYAPETSDPKLTELLDAKYHIMLDIAQRQIEYKKIIDSVMK